ERFEPRYVQNTLKTLDLLDKNDAKATFFTLGWIAEQTPDLIREIVKRGHEIASRGFEHHSLKQMTRNEFQTDLLKTRDALEKASGQQIFGHRAAEKLSYKTDLWTLEILAKENFAYDASFMPTWNAVKNARFWRYAHEHRTKDGTIWEIPYSTIRLTDYLLPISGGNYFRQIPYTFLRKAVNRWHETKSAPFVMYFHVWELDAEQPRINAASSLNQVRHYRKLDKMEWILNENLSQYHFTSAKEYLEISDKFAMPHSAELLANVDDTSLRKSEAVSMKPSVAEKISIVIPCYNEEANLPYLAKTLRSVEEKLENYDIRYVFIDDCSRDGTFARLNEIFGSQANVKIVQHAVNKGVAGGMMTGIRNAETEIVCAMDADCSYDPHELAAMIEVLLEGGFDVVTASPYHPNGGVRNIPAWRLSLSKSASWMYRRVLRTKLHTYTSCFRVYRKSVVENIELRENGFVGVTELLGKLDLQGAKITEHATVLEVRLFGFSKMKTARTIVGHLKLL
ncbi:MAG: glycosyltransferase, partial [Pyrinomonadaceae bacterium]|nr:glycosyltransferase [Pyrinomonadaceae bacterium]